MLAEERKNNWRDLKDLNDKIHKQYLGADVVNWNMERNREMLASQVMKD